jgi:hypothetical protein
MNPESANLLNDLTCSGRNSGDFLIQALHIRARRRAQYRIAAVCALTLTALAMLAGHLAPIRKSSPPVAVTPPAQSHQLTSDELLDSFPDQPIALVTWPDGRQQLLAIAHPAPASKIR